MRAYFYDSGDNPISNSDVASGVAGTLTTSWQYKGGRFTTPANAAKMRIQLYNYMNSGWVAFDDVSLRQVSNFSLSYDAENRLVGVSGGGDGHVLLRWGWEQG